VIEKKAISIWLGGLPAAATCGRVVSEGIHCDDPDHCLSKRAGIKQQAPHQESHRAAYHLSSAVSLILLQIDAHRPETGFCLREAGHGLAKDGAMRSLGVYGIHREAGQTGRFQRGPMAMKLKWPSTWLPSLRRMTCGAQEVALLARISTKAAEKPAELTVAVTDGSPEKG